MKYLLQAFSFLTLIPVNLNAAPARGDSGKAALWFPLVGIFIGGLSAIALMAFRLVFSPYLAAVLAVFLWIALSGGLHLDGLADCCDGMLHASSPSRRLEIMKDPRLGTFGGIGLILAILLKIALVSEFSVSAIIWLPLAAGLGRWMLLPMGKLPVARPGGMGADFSVGLSYRIIAGAVIPVLFMTILAGWRGLAAALAAHIVGWIIARAAQTRLGGVTGDVLGLTVECVEMAVLFIGCI